MSKVRDEKIKLNNMKIFNMLALMVNLEEKVPDEMKLKESKYNGSEVFEKGTEALDKQKFGVELTHSSLLPFITYFRECMSNSEAENIVIGIIPHSNDRTKNIKFGACEYKDADFAEISVITSEKTILMHLNYKNPITQKIGNYVEVKNTSWKVIPALGIRGNRRKSLIDRVIVTAANMVEQSENRKFKSKNEFMNYFIHVEAVDPNEITKRIKNEGVLNNFGNLKILELNHDDMKIKILKMIYNKLKNESLRLSSSGGFDDRTYVEFEVGNNKLSFDMSLNNIRAELEV